MYSDKEIEVLQMGMSKPHWRPIADLLAKESIKVLGESYKEYYEGEIKKLMEKYNTPDGFFNAKEKLVKGLLKDVNQKPLKGSMRYINCILSDEQQLKYFFWGLDSSGEPEEVKQFYDNQEREKQRLKKIFDKEALMKKDKAAIQKKKVTEFNKRKGKKYQRQATTERD